MGIQVQPCCCNQPCCPIVCHDSTFSGQFAVTLAGFQNGGGTCGHCTDFNGTFVLTCGCTTDPHGAKTCYWYYNSPNTYGCSGGSTPLGFTLQLQFNHVAFGNYNIIFLSLADQTIYGALQPGDPCYTSGTAGGVDWAQGGFYGGGTVPNPLTCGSISGYSIPLYNVTYSGGLGSAYCYPFSAGYPTATITAV